MIKLSLSLFCLFIASIVNAQQRDNVCVSDFGASLNSYENCVAKLQAAIESNVIKTFGYPIFYAKSTAELTFKDNIIIHTQTIPAASGNKNTFYLNGCKDVVIRGNRFERYTPRQLVKIENMKSKYLKITNK